MKKVLLVSDYLLHYRIAMFNLLCDKIDLTIAHSSNISDSNFKFSEHKISLKFRGSFVNYENLPDLSEFDIVIFEFKLGCWPIYKNLLRKRSYKLFIFGIGVSAGYEKRYDHEKVLNIIRKFILKHVDGAIFYDRYPFTKWIARGINPRKLSIAYNTVPLDPGFNIKDKTFESFIFIGTLYRQKKIFDLLYAYKYLVEKHGLNIPNLEIVGNGDEYDSVSNWVHREKLKTKIVLHGKINNDKELRPIFSRAIACVSPNQAGLSVQKCFSYGVPFITAYNAITGGEISSIINKNTGFFYDNTVRGLCGVLDKIILKEFDIIEMSLKCHVFYKNFRSVDIWKNGFLENIIK